MKVGDLIHDSDYGMKGIVLEIVDGVCTILYESGDTHRSSANWAGIETINESR